MRFTNFLTVSEVRLKLESLSTDVFEPRTSTGSLCFSFSTFSCPTNELPSSHFSIYNLIFSTKSELYAPKRSSFDFRLTSVAQKRLCLSFLLFKWTSETVRSFVKRTVNHWRNWFTKGSTSRSRHYSFTWFRHRFVSARDFKSRNCFPWHNTMLTLTYADLKSNVIRSANPNTKR